MMHGMSRSIWIVGLFSGVGAVCSSVLPSSGVSAPWVGSYQSALRVAWPVIVQSPWLRGGLGVTSGLCFVRGAHAMWKDGISVKQLIASDKSGEIALEFLLALRAYITQRREAITAAGITDIVPLCVDDSSALRLSQSLDAVFENTAVPDLSQELRTNLSNYYIHLNSKYRASLQDLGRQPKDQEPLDLISKTFGTLFFPTQGTWAQPLKIDGAWQLHKWQLLIYYSFYESKKQAILDIYCQNSLQKVKSRNTARALFGLGSIGSLAYLGLSFYASKF